MVAGCALLMLAACAGYQNKAIPTSDRYVYKIAHNRTIDVDESRLAQLADSWRPVAEAAEPSKTRGPDRVRALNMVALHEELNFSCRNIRSLQVIRHSSGFLGLSMTHGVIHTNPSIDEDWNVKACDKERSYLIFGEEGRVDLYYLGEKDYVDRYLRPRP